MRTEGFEHDEITAASGITYEIDQCTLFSFKQKEMNIHLGVSEIIQASQTDDLQLGRDPGGMLTKRDVEFIYLAARFQNDFEAISKVLSLITTAEQNQFGLKHQELSMACMVPYSRLIDTDNSIHAEVDFAVVKPVQATIFVRKAQFRSVGYGLGFTMGLKTAQRTWSIDLPIFWVHHLKNGLKKALNWIKPAAGIRAS